MEQRPFMKKHIRHAILRALLLPTSVVFLAELCHLQGQSPLFTVVSPVEGQEVSAGSSVQLVLSPAPAVSLNDVEVWSPIGSYIQHTASPITIGIPNNRLGPVKLLIVGKSSDGSVLEINRTIKIDTFITLNAIRVNPAVARLVAPGSSTNGISETRLSISGIYEDGIIRDISRLPQAVVASDNPTVATVDSTGFVKAHAPGQASVSVAVGSIIGNSRILVNIFELQGDLNGDGRVDQNDLKAMLAALNTKASGPGDPRDLNSDGSIDNVDVTLLQSTCSDDCTPATNVSAQVSITQSGFVRNRATGLWIANMVLTNISKGPINGPINIVLANLTPGVTMVGNSGVFGTNAQPFITVPVGALAPGSAASVSIQFTNPSNGLINFTGMTYSGTL
jgi:hypothetical protein